MELEVPEVCPVCGQPNSTLVPSVELEVSLVDAWPYCSEACHATDIERVKRDDAEWAADYEASVALNPEWYSDTGEARLTERELDEVAENVRRVTAGRDGVG